MSSRSRNPALYGLAVLLLCIEIGVLWLVLHPDVPASYRAYYIDQTTTCLDQPVSGAYAFGTNVSFRSDGALSKPLRVCGWEGPVGDGLHAVGESARLRFALPEGAGKLELSLELVAVDRAPGGRQAVEVMTNGSKAATISVLSGTPQRFEIPLAVPPGTKLLELELLFPEAISGSPQESRTRKRSVKLTEARVGAI